MTGDDPRPFLDVPTLLERSQPRSRAGWFWYAAGSFLLLVLLSTYAQQQGAARPDTIQFLAGAGMFALMIVMALVTFAAARSHRREQLEIASVEEAVQLRRWSQAARILDGLLSQPTRSPQARVQGLIFLSTVLARYDRFADAIAVHEHLLDHVPMDEASTYALRLGRAMALIRDTRLVDADRAISDLRRSPAAQESAGLVMVELYRYVVTGHPDDAVGLFQAKLPLLRRQLGHRAADAWALVARAYDALGRTAEAQEAYTNATLLAPAMELGRRYPEVVALAAKYQAAPAPAGMIQAAADAPAAAPRGAP